MNDQAHEDAVRTALAAHGQGSIEVYCQEKSHEDERWDMGRFELETVGPDEPLGIWIWCPRASRRRGGRKNRSRRDKLLEAGYEPASSNGPQLLFGNWPVPQHVHDPESSPEPIRIRHPLKCGRCDLSLPRRDRSLDDTGARAVSRNEDRLQIVLDILLIAGVPKISLSALAARMLST